MTLALNSSCRWPGPAIDGVVDARRADQLTDHDALGAVDDERALLGHEREVAHVHALALDLARLLDEQLDPDVERLREGQVPRAALELAVLGRFELVILEAQLHYPAGEVLDGADLIEQLAQPVLNEPVERLQLQLDQVRDGQDFGDPGVGSCAGPQQQRHAGTARKWSASGAPSVTGRVLGEDQNGRMKKGRRNLGTDSEAWGTALTERT